MQDFLLFRIIETESEINSTPSSIKLIKKYVFSDRTKKNMYICKKLKIMKVRFYRWYNVVLTALLAVLGYGCKENTIAEYGSPNADYQLMGNVTDDTGKPVDGILVSVEASNYSWYLASTRSTFGGEYRTPMFNYVSELEHSDIKIVVQDVDGEKNGEYANDTIDIDYKSKIQTKEAKGWYQGAWRISQDIQLKKK